MRAIERLFCGFEYLGIHNLLWVTRYLVCCPTNFWIGSDKEKGLDEKEMILKKEIICLKSGISHREYCHLQENSTHNEKEKNNLKIHIGWKTKKGKCNCVLFSKQSEGTRKVNVRMKNSAEKLRAPEHISHKSALCLIYNCSAAFSSRRLVVSADPEWI